MTEQPTGHAEPEPGPEAAGGAGPVPRRRGHRRATGGTAPHAEPEPRASRAREDTDAAWGGRDEGDDDERILREVPPHW